MIPIRLNFILDLCAVSCVAAIAGASSEGRKDLEASTESTPLLTMWAIFAGVCLAVTSILAMACCNFFRGRGKTIDDPETMEETGNTLNVAAGNDVRMSHQSRPDTDVAGAKPYQTTSFNLQSEVVGVGPVESNGPQRQIAIASGMSKGMSPADVQEAKEFKGRSNSMASLGTIGRESVEAVTLVSRDNNGIGLTVVNRGTDEGLFIKDVLLDGPAGQSRRLNSGDRIVSMAICMEKMTVDDAQALFQLARIYPVELHFVKGQREVVVQPPSAKTVVHPFSAQTVEADQFDERGRSWSAGCLPTLEEVDAEARLHPDRPSASLTQLPFQGQISRWRNEAELSPEVKVQSDGSTFEGDVRTMSQVASTQSTVDSDDEEMDEIAAGDWVNAAHPSEHGKHPGERQAPAAAAGLDEEYEATEGHSQNQGANDESDVDFAEDVEGEEEEEVEEAAVRIGIEKGAINNGRQPRAVEFGAYDSLAEPTWQSDFKIELPHMGVDNALEGVSRAQRSEIVEAEGISMTSAYQGDGDIEDPHQNNRDVSRTGKGGYGRVTSTHGNSSSENGRDQNEDERTATVSIGNIRTVRGIPWTGASSPEGDSDEDTTEALGPSSTRVDVDRRALSFGVKAGRGKEGEDESTGVGASDDDGEANVAKTRLEVDVGERSDLVDPSLGLGSPMQGLDSDGRGFDYTKASEAQNIFGGKGLRRNPAEEGNEDVKVVRQGQTDSYYERFCDAVETGLPGRVIDLDVVDEGQNEDEERQEGNDAELGLEVKKSEVKALGSASTTPALAFKGPNFEESVPQVSGNVSPEGVSLTSGWSKQSPPHTKESRVKGSTSIGDRLKGFFSPKKGSKDKDSHRGDSQETSVRASDFAYTPAQPPAQITSAESWSADEVRISQTDGEESNRTGFEGNMRGAPQQGTPSPTGVVVLSNGGGDGKRKQMNEDGAEETWARSYSVNAGGISANTARRALDYSARGKGGIDEDAAPTEEGDLVESNEWKRDAPYNDYDYPRKLSPAERENEEEGEANGIQSGRRTSPPGSDVPGFVFDGKDFNEFYYGMAFYGKDMSAAGGLEGEERGHRVQSVDTGTDVRVVNGDYAMGSEGESINTTPLHQQTSSDDDDEIISYSSNFQTRFPADESLPQGRVVAEHGKETSDRGTTSTTLPTSNRSNAFEFLDLNQFSLEPLELPSWESLGLSSRQNGIEAPSSHDPNATKYKTTGIVLTASSEDQNNNALIEDSSNA